MLVLDHCYKKKTVLVFLSLEVCSTTIPQGMLWDEFLPCYNVMIQMIDGT